MHGIPAWFTLTGFILEMQHNMFTTMEAKRLRKLCHQYFISLLYIGCPIIVEHISLAMYGASSFPPSSICFVQLCIKTVMGAVVPFNARMSIKGILWMVVPSPIHANPNTFSSLKSVMDEPTQCCCCSLCCGSKCCLMLTLLMLEELSMLQIF